MGVSTHYTARPIAGNSRPRTPFPAGEANPPSRYANESNLVASGFPILHVAIIQTLADQGLVLSRPFEGKIAACELAGPRSKLKNRTNTALRNPLCRSADELCTKRDGDFTELGQDLEKPLYPLSPESLGSQG
jgi:hypothetical protein